jgi:Domain of unknown function (DUF5606)
MELLKDIVNVSGKGGLFKIVKPGRVGVIVESLDDKREKTMIGPTARVSALKDISIFMADGNDATLLSTILRNAHAKYEGQPFDVKALSDYELVDFMEAVTPGYDTDRVYLSDMRKLATWYNILIKNMPELFEPEVIEAAPTEVEAAVEDPMVKAVEVAAGVEQPAAEVVQEPKKKAKKAAKA